MHLESPLGDVRSGPKGSRWAGALFFLPPGDSIALKNGWPHLDRKENGRFQGLEQQ